MTLFDKFRDLAICNPSNGRTILFWTDKWSDQSLQELYPQLFSFTKKKKCSIRFFLDQDVNIIFSLPLLTQATNQLEEVQTLIQQRTWNADTKDIWCYSWGSCKYSSKKAYKIMIGHTETSPLFNWMWASATLVNISSSFGSCSGIESTQGTY